MSNIKIVFDAQMSSEINLMSIVDASIPVPFCKTGILDANMGNIDIAFGDIEVDVAFFGSSATDKNDGLNADFDSLIKAEPKAPKEIDNDIELDVETEPSAIKRGPTKPSTQNEKDKKAQSENQKKKKEAEKKKKEPSVTINISYKDIQVSRKE